ncbi:hypothetical protein MRX96_033806 [Rhipicephalus microplus]
MSPAAAAAAAREHDKKLLYFAGGAFVVIAVTTAFASIAIMRSALQNVNKHRRNRVQYTLQAADLQPLGTPPGRGGPAPQQDTGALSIGRVLRQAAQGGRRSQGRSQGGGAQAVDQKETPCYDQEGQEAGRHPPQGWQDCQDFRK